MKNNEILTQKNSYAMNQRQKRQSILAFIGCSIIEAMSLPVLYQELFLPIPANEPPLARPIMIILFLICVPALIYTHGYLSMYKNNCTYTFKDETLEVTRFGKIIKSFQKSEIVNMELSDYLLTARIRRKDGSTLRCERTIEDYKDFIAHLESWSGLKMENKNYDA